ncbi:hypothetical protein JKF63_02794 [Porcisia hertigi]|uniref:Endonuclease/exonuclease/phosphatase domain-containing protein n=1 Tax=Porcisia hertigi TaxID=2761500 RepID=A0A836IN58_9TRYP|nr:hypothetical protein JKF63_02794 [Porcisia hertigi]
MSQVSTVEAGALPIRVLTFNLWGIFNSKMRKARMKAFAAKIDNYDVILLQEQFSAEDFDLIFQHASPAVQQTYTFRRFRSSFYGSGCAVISRYPISQAFFHVYPLQGYPEMILHGDFYANKGAAMVRVMAPVAANDGCAGNKMQEVTLYTTHLVAVYQRASQLPSWREERYLPFRISQAISLAKFIMSTSRPTDHIIIGGDFNCSQKSLEVQTMLILLKRHGYDIGSVLASPRPLQSGAMSEQEREREQRLYTYSQLNAFNSMRTSYFKLLKLESDTPVQIDHIFFSRGPFTLCHFANCPDVEDSDYPRTLQDAPSGLVVFTKNVVHVPPKPTWCGSLWHQLLTGKHTFWCGNKARQPAQSSDKAVEPTEVKGADDYYPLSDHFGVAALLSMRVEDEKPLISKGGAGTEACGGATPLLTPEEKRVVETVADFLESCVDRLRSQVKMTRYVAVSSFLLAAANMWVLWRLSAKEQARTAAVLEQVYNMAAASTRDGAREVQEGNVLQSVKQGFGLAKDWASSHLHTTLDTARKFIGSAPAHGRSISDTSAESKEPAVTVGDQSAALLGAASEFHNTTASKRDDPATTGRPEFRAMAKALALRPLWASTWVCCIFDMTAAVVGTASLAIGTFQRAGNAAILEEQLKELKML